jgi:Tol biopolymer transport system component
VYGSRDRDTGSQIRIIDIGTMRDRHLLPYSWLDRDIRWSPTGEWIAFELTDSTYRKLGGIYLVRPDGGEIVRLTESQHSLHELHGWAPDSTAVVYQAGSELRMIDIESLEERVAKYRLWASETRRELIVTDPYTFREFSFEMPGEPEDANCVVLRWTPDLRHVAVFAAKWCEEGFAPTTLYWVDTSSGQGHRIETDGFNLWEHTSLSPDGTTLAFAAAGLDEHSADRAAIYFLHMSAGRLSGFVNVPEFSILGPAWSPDGSMLTFVEYRRHPEVRRTLGIYHFDTKEIVYPSDTLEDEWEEWSAAWSPRMVYGPGACLGQDDGD